MSRICLLTPPMGAALGLEMITMVEPLGLEYIAGALEEDGHECRIIDIRIDGIKNGLDSIRKFAPDIIGVQCNFTNERFRAARIIGELKRVFPDIFVVAGGHDASREPEWYLNAGSDVVVLGDGEEVMPELVRTWSSGDDLSLVPGLAIPARGEMVYTGAARVRDNIDDLPLPARHLIKRYAPHYYSSYLKPTALLETARGCPFRCSFCSVWKFHEGRCRQKSAHRILRELRDISAPNVFITDDIFWLNKHRDDELAQMIIDAGIHKHFILQTRTDVIARSPELVEKWKKCGDLTVFLGLEKLDDMGLESVNKSNTAGNNDRAIQILRKLQVAYSPNFIIDPDWNREDFARLRQWITQTKSYNSGFSILTPLPGTDLWDGVANQIITRDWELFDLEHAVLPTRLSLGEFYREYAGLWRHALKVRYQTKGRWRDMWRLIREVALGRVKPDALRKGLQLGKMLSKPESFLRAHLESEVTAPSASHSNTPCI